MKVPSTPFDLPPELVDQEPLDRALGIDPRWGDVTLLEGKAYYRHDYYSCDGSESQDIYYDTQEMLAKLGYTIDDPQIEHDCLTGFIKPLT